MTTGLPAYHQEDFMVPVTLHPGVIWQALQTLGWGGSGTPDGTHFTASVSMSLGSWGENVSVTRVAPDRITVRSQCMMPTQMFDWGKNEKNVRQFLSTLVAIGQGQAPQRF